MEYSFHMSNMESLDDFLLMIIIFNSVKVLSTVKHKRGSVKNVGFLQNWPLQSYVWIVA